eukprot:2046450-Rhodomonas_salina.1
MLNGKPFAANVTQVPARPTSLCPPAAYCPKPLLRRVRYCATAGLVLTWRTCYALSGTHVAYGGTELRLLGPRPSAWRCDARWYCALSPYALPQDVQY